MVPVVFFLFFFFNDTATTEIYTLSLHDALPISVDMQTNGHYIESMNRKSESHTQQVDLK